VIRSTGAVSLSPLPVSLFQCVGLSILALIVLSRSARLMYCLFADSLHSDGSFAPTVQDILPQISDQRTAIALGPFAHASTSSIGRAAASTIRIGRPILEIFCTVGSMPSALATVAKKSGTATGLSFIIMPSGLV
jgi:hypothetical protein